MFVNKLFTYLTPHISKSERCFTVKSSTHYFYMKKRSVPLRYFLGEILVPIFQFTEVASSVLLTKRTGFRTGFRTGYELVIIISFNKFSF